MRSSMEESSQMSWEEWANEQRFHEKLKRLAGHVTRMDITHCILKILGCI